jgi:hypothetical protein
MDERGFRKINEVSGVKISWKEMGDDGKVSSVRDEKWYGYGMNKV